MKQIILIFFLFQSLSFISVTSLVSATPDKEKVYNDLIKKYGKINTVSVVFNNGDLEFNVKAKRENKYKIKYWNSEITSDGKTVWNYDSHKKSVIISNFEKTNNMVDMFLNELSNVQATELKTELSNKGKRYLLELRDGEKNLNGDFHYITLYMDEKLDKILEIKITEVNKNYDVIHYKSIIIKKLEINKPIPDSVFVFKTPKGVEEIDTR